MATSYDAQMAKLRAEKKELERLSKGVDRLLKSMFGYNAEELGKLIEDSKKASAPAPAPTPAPTENPKVSSSADVVMMDLGYSVAEFYELGTLEAVQAFINISLTEASKDFFLRQYELELQSEIEVF